tara:strand:- start:1000 stop:1125 length:126 start_codon:yes stop_codon:yes gene_type:complete
MKWVERQDIAGSKNLHYWERITVQRMGSSEAFSNSGLAGEK